MVFIKYHFLVTLTSIIITQSSSSFQSMVVPQLKWLYLLAEVGYRRLWCRVFVFLLFIPGNIQFWNASLYVDA